jgi:predicted ester cyclase
MTSDELTKFAKRYAEAWCSQNPEKVAAFFAQRGSISINNGPPAVGRATIAREAQGFMKTFPDMTVMFDKLERGTPDGGRSSCDAVFDWTLTGTNTGPGGSGKRVRISGYELWKIGNDGLIAESKGNFDSAEYERQLKHGADIGRGD